MSKLEQKQDTISIAEAAKRLGIEMSYAYGLARSGRLDAQKSGREWLVSAQAVEERLERLSK